MSITEKTVTEHVAALRKKEYSATELTKACLAKTEKENPELCAFVYTDGEQALLKAKKADEMLFEGTFADLCGIPYGVKDNICQRGVPTCAASAMLSGFVPPYESTVTDRLEKSGAISLGHTNMDEFAMGSTTVSDLYGATKNPLCQSLTAGGSSGGSAAAVAAGLVPFALGSDTGGSVRQPAAFCGVVGLSPTYGALSRHGLIAFASSLDRIGIIARSCTDCALVLRNTAGKDPLDSTTKDFAFDTGRLEKPVKGLRIGIADSLFFGVDEDIKKEILSCARTLSDLGCEIVMQDLPSVSCAAEAYYVISSAEASSNLGRYDGVRFGHRTSKPVSSMEDFYRQNRTEGFGDEVKRRIMLGTFVLSEGYGEGYYKRALQVRDMICKDYKRAFEKCDLILSPTSPCLPYPQNEKKDNAAELYALDRCTVSQSLALLPSLSVPCKGKVRGMPVGMQLTGDCFSEALLLSVGKAYEEAVK